MNKIDEIAPSFLHAKQLWAHATNLEAHYCDLAITYENGGSSLIELCKSYIETVCITILNEFGEKIETNTPTTQEYIVKTLQKLGISNTRGASQFDKVLSCYNKLTEALTNVRNTEGNTAHGKDGFIENISEKHLKVYLLLTDSILTLILEALRGTTPSLKHTRAPYENFEHLHEKIDLFTRMDCEIDEQGSLIIKIISNQKEEETYLSFKLSEILYYLDRQVYIERLNLVKDLQIISIEPEEVEEEKSENESKEVIQATPKIEKTKKNIDPAVVENYEGKYSFLKNDLYDYLTNNTVLKEENASKAQNFTYTLLQEMEGLSVIDWDKKLSTKAAVKSTIKRALKNCSINTNNKDKLVDSVINWLETNIPGEIE